MNIKRKISAGVAAATLVVAAGACEFHDGRNAAETARFHCEQATQLWRGYYPNAVFEPSTIVRHDVPGRLSDNDACLIYSGPNQGHPGVYAVTYYNDGDRVEWENAD